MSSKESGRRRHWFNFFRWHEHGAKFGWTRGTDGRVREIVTSQKLPVKFTPSALLLTWANSVTVDAQKRRNNAFILRHFLPNCSQLAFVADRFCGPMEFSPDNTPFGSDQLLSWLNLSFVEFARDRRDNFISFNALHPYSDAYRFRFLNAYDIFSYSLFRKVLSPSIAANRRFELAEALTDVVAEVVERAGMSIPTEMRPELMISIAAIAKEYGACRKIGWRRRKEAHQLFAREVLDTWDSLSLKLVESTTAQGGVNHWVGKVCDD